MQWHCLRERTIASEEPGNTHFAMFACRYGFEALVYTEFHGAQPFYFTPYAQKRAPGAKLPSVEVDGDTVMETFGFATHDLGSNLRVLLLLLVIYLTITLVLLSLRRHA